MVFVCCVMREHGDDDSSHFLHQDDDTKSEISLYYVHTVRMTYNIIQLMLGKFTTTKKDFFVKRERRDQEIERERERDVVHDW